MDERKEPLADKGTSLSGSTAGFGPQSAFRLILAMCAAEVLSMVGVFAFPALLPRFSREWGLSNTQAGWINGIYFAGYTATVPVLVSLTDRIGPRRIYLLFASVGTLASLAFALFARGLWTALLFRLLGGLGLAGTFIPGLKSLVDRLEGPSQARAVSFYTATFGIGTSLSFFATGKIGAMFSWRWAFVLAVAAGFLALLLAKIALHPKPPQQKGVPETRLLDFRPHP